MLCLNFWANAQAVDVTKKGLQIGQQVPDLTLTNLHNYNDAAGKPATTAKLSDFRGKLLILDFWATWCSPCVTMIPKMDSLQKQFADKMQFLSVTYEAPEVVLPFLEKLEKQHGKNHGLSYATSNKNLAVLFPHMYLPHYVWISADGIVLAITGLAEINSVNIQNFGKAARQKHDLKVAYNENLPLFIGGNGGNGNNMIFHTVLTKYQEGLAAGWLVTRKKDSDYLKITGWNQSILKLFALSYHDRGYFVKNRIVIEAKDRLPLVWPEDSNIVDWKRKYTYCYEIILPKEQEATAFSLMRQDLARSFPQYGAILEKRKLKCLVLQRTSTIDKLKSSGGNSLVNVGEFGCVLQNSFLSQFFNRLENLYLYNSKLPLFNETGYKGRIDLKVDANLSDVKAVNAELAKYDLKFIEEEREIDMLVIRDREVKENTKL